MPASSSRLTTLPTYVFAWLDELKHAARSRGASLIDLGIGNPDQPTPPEIVEAIATAYRDPATHGYPPFKGTPAYLAAITRYMERRFGVQLDPAREVLALSGAKEGIAHLTIAVTDDGSTTLVPDIYYPVHARASLLAGGAVHSLPLRAEHGFLPVLADVPTDVARRARLLILNYPHNPTGAGATRALFEEAVAFCREHDTVLLSDLAYAEITFDGQRAPSVLEVPGARDVAVEFHSLSKSFNMAGSRIGFAVGNEQLLKALYAVRTNMGYGTPAAIQAGAAFALDNAERFTGDVARRYERRRDHAVAGFRRLGWTVHEPKGAMFLWLEVPPGFTSEQWTEHLIDRASVVVTPGTAFGPGGEGYFRVSLVAEPEVFDQVFERIARIG